MTVEELIAALTALLPMGVGGEQIQAHGSVDGGCIRFVSKVESVTVETTPKDGLLMSTVILNVEETR